jgi:hypothetical protein
MPPSSMSRSRLTGVHRIRRARGNVLTNASVIALVSAVAFFLLFNVHMAIVTSWDLSFWGFVVYLAGAGGIIVFVLSLASAMVADRLVSRLPVSMSERAQSWWGAGFLACLLGAETVPLLVIAALQGEWWVVLLPSSIASVTAAGLSFPRAIRTSWRNDRGEGKLYFTGTMS